MSKSEEPVLIRKYPNRRLYLPSTSTYVTLRDLTKMVKSGKDFVVYDTETDEDLTRLVLAQIIFDQAKTAGKIELPITFLRQLICFFGDRKRMPVLRDVKVSTETLAREQEESRKRLRADRIKRPVRWSVKGR